MKGLSTAKTPRNVAKIGDGIHPAQNVGWGLNSNPRPEYLPLGICHIHGYFFLKKRPEIERKGPKGI